MNKLFASLVISSALITGCASNNKVSDSKFSGFLDDYTILKPTSADKEALGYVTPGINWQKYNAIMVDKVLIITPDAETQTDQKLLVAIAEKYEALLKQKLAKEFNVVNNAGSGTIRLQTAITSVFSSFDDLKGYQYVPIAAAVTGGRRAAGGEKESARVMSELRILDSVDGQLLGQAVDLKAGKKKQDKNSAILLADINPILEQWATRVVDRLKALRAEVR
ncbi:MAG: DUF3313 domain-containing protein [gamma proteobacterium symbiont of Taylorina sp.]|nr:DUF3313 domain-containing protein [gamma proteobacterium symbiont of Taylorina sp.]